MKYFASLVGLILLSMWFGAASGWFLYDILMGNVF